MTGQSNTPPSDPSKLPIDKTPGQLIFASLVCFFGGVFIVVFAFILCMIFQTNEPFVVAGLIWPLWFAAKILVVATILACFNKKPGHR